jgi:2'-5' RNA ligase
MTESTAGRYFFAIWPGREISRQLARETNQLNIRGRPHQPSDLHITLVFLGQVAEDQIPCMEKTADQIRSAPFSLQIDSMGYWRRPRILWAGPKVTPEPLSQLVLDLQKGLAACGFEPERRQYKPHITLYRKVAGADPKAIEPAIEWPVSEFVLAVSGTNRPGEPRYRILKRWPCVG